ncbi:lysyl-tRNA synthetase, class II [Isorropodon fossajaponicum endosymbiont JTNG4]|uniref:EF-P lysine aminoacylase EpmA n=1 Tax=Isorropodon fossajaponicum symbiont TaxID=883811 RepID=UPI00191528AE|nr:EF-P lysine aminoacylase EpmA [Isorropodon fossajaponicum symbiont]BBB23702.1 lysyl-tRNA synthetase, class II [Isorropodon fossajaponicum endosymbiont JTNG4]
MQGKSGLIKRRRVIQKIRQFFEQQAVLEVHTPTLINAPTSDVYIDSISLSMNADIGMQSIQYLHTSPELEMKKLLAQGSGDIYQICQVFRDNEYGERNSNEFTLLEYYRLGFDIHQLMADMVNLLQALGLQDKVHQLSYAQVFSQYADIDVLNTDFDALKVIASKLGLGTDFAWIEELQMLLFVHLVEPKLKNLPLCFIYDYPESQSALAKVKNQVAHRFELYLNGIEVANGYDELQTKGEYQQVFTCEITKRKQLGKPILQIDDSFLSKLNKPLPQCAGVAIGINRLLTQIS